MADFNELRIPVAAQEDPNSFELIRVWVANNDQHVSLRADVWQDPAAWGILLCDLMQHIAEAYHQDQMLDRTETLRRIAEGMNAELEGYSDDAGSG